MNLIKRNERIRQFFENDCMPLLEKKGADYSIKNQVEEQDANGLFVLVSYILGNVQFDKYYVWSVLFIKQMLSIFTWIRNRKLQSESLGSRIADAVNYLLILETMIEEPEHDETKK